MKTRTIEVPHTIELASGEEFDVIVRVALTGRYTAATYNDPPEGPDAEIVSVHLDAPGYPERPEWLALVESLHGIIDEAMEQDMDDDRGAWADEQERRADADRDDRRMGQGRYEVQP